MNNSKTSLFLMELIISILLFSVSSVVCVQLFVNSHMTNIETTKTSGSNLVLQNMSEAYFGCDGNLDEIKDLFEHSLLSADNNNLVVNYNNDWIPCEASSDEKEYTAEISLYNEGAMTIASITVRDIDGEVISVQDLKHYNQYHLEEYANEEE